MRKIKFATGEYYHIYNRGNNKQNIFLTERDYIRFVFLILTLQLPDPLYNVSRQVNYFIKHGRFAVSKKHKKGMNEKRIVELTGFCLMPNHFHILIKELSETGISSYMMKVQDSYTKYWNIKHKISGHLFQGPFQAVHISSNEQLLHLSAYIHKNPRELKNWKNKEYQYTWSSYSDYSSECNRWKKLLETKIISDQFDNPQEYGKFVEASKIRDKLDLELVLE